MKFIISQSESNRVENLMNNKKELYIGIEVRHPSENKLEDAHISSETDFSKQKKLKVA